ncbi:tetratricopeptide repeat protein [Polynucleobacter sp. 31A-FELB]|uniref:tetratricopeptide repeat protein n=1 Tax=Polynucleobacter sp. 31A-FELB TaxID=2689096 RepID=UPI001C0E08D8|nr:tetratricopeptide repeat protein [Polynucleobacter sp. 31A-FELB]MBU3587816.1 tetratricopeptide repeat protein [Polynucleobacter sp. 31A-FELB]
MKIDTVFLSALNAHQQGDIKSAQLGYKKILRVKPLHFDALHLLGVCYFNDQKLQESKQHIKRALVVNNKFAEAHFNLGNTLLALGELIEAKQSYQKAIDLKTNYIDAYSNLGTVLRSLSELEQAQQVYKKALQIAPSVQLWYNYGNILADQKLFDQAKVAFKNAIELDSEAFAAWDSLGSIYANQGRYDEALPNYQKAITLQPEFAEGHSNISGVFIELGKLDKGLNHAKKAFELNPDNIFALSNLGSAQINNGLFDDAFLTLQKAYEINPRFLKCNSALGRLNCLLGQWDKAIENYGISYKIDPENEGLEDGVYLAVLAYLLGDASNCQRYLEITKSAKDGGLLIHKGAKAYWLFLNRLLQHFQDKNYIARPARIHVIGESHSLPYSGLEITFDDQIMQCQSLWIPGCKQWHLGNTQPNQYKAAVINHFRSLPKSSTVLMAIGEIDCRPDEGIVKFMYNNPEMAIDAIVNETINNYLNWLVQANTEMQHQIIVSGVPASNIDFNKLEFISKLGFAELLSTFNEVLKSESQKRGFKFLDIFSMTNFGDGVSNGKWHIDEFHLSPAAGQEAFKNHLTFNP